ncbi:MAG: hypothetical protein ACFB10_18275, partial [Salibacteraceae bacterium]
AQSQDKGSFVPYKNAFYQNIKQQLNQHEQSGSGGSTSFKMDPSGINIPSGPEAFNSVWCQAPESQGRTGTCWCFSTTSYFEAEVFRLSGEKVELSELYIVYWEYVEKAREFVRTRGDMFFGEGSETNAVIRMMAAYGAVPASAYEGKPGEQPYHDHAGMFDEMEAYLATLKRDNAWNEDVAIGNIRAILDHYLGAPPTAVTWKGKTMSPVDFRKNVLKIVPEDYVNFMSLMEVPFYQQGEYDVPDNWWNSNAYYNMPLNDFMAALKASVENGYSVAIGGDVSESGYLPNYDIAVVPSYDIPGDRIDDYSRQLRFTNEATTDDHAIHLIGYLQQGEDYWFLIKDSGSGARNGKHPGYYFYHEDYVKLKMMNFTVHKDAVGAWLKKFKNS